MEYSSYVTVNIYSLAMTYETKVLTKIISRVLLSEMENNIDIKQEFSPEKYILLSYLAYFLQLLLIIFMPTNLFHPQ